MWNFRYSCFTRSNIRQTFTWVSEIIHQKIEFILRFVPFFFFFSSSINRFTPFEAFFHVITREFSRFFHRTKVYFLLIFISFKYKLNFLENLKDSTFIFGKIPKELNSNVFNSRQNSTFHLCFPFKITLMKRNSFLQT